MQKIAFEYNIKKDIENCLFQLSNKQYREMSDISSKFYNTYRNLNKINLNIFISNFLIENKINTEEKINYFNKDWKMIELEVFKRMDKIFNSKSNRNKIIVYLTINNMCSLNIEKSYFFVHINSKEYRQIVIHELLHFFTWDLYRRKLMKNKCSDTTYFIMQESLAELLSIEFKDLLNGAKDFGYPEHENIRSFIREEWKKEKNIEKIINKLVEKLK